MILSQDLKAQYARIPGMIWTPTYFVDKLALVEERPHLLHGTPVLLVEFSTSTAQDRNQTLLPAKQSTMTSLALADICQMQEPFATHQSIPQMEQVWF